MKVSKAWLKELVDLNISMEELERLLPLRTIASKEVTEDFIELDMKGYNRADLLSMRGVAKEVAAITNSQSKFSDPEKVNTDLPSTDIQIDDPKLCPVYCIVKIEGLKSGPSNPEWVKKLADSGMRTVNNIADVTNLIMLEFGQPMHSFDAQKVRGSVRVRVAKQGEKIKTLDDKVRNLDEADLLIADDENPLGIAGVMGGKDSEASDSTTSILLEAAIFDPISIRRSVQRHNLYSEASKRFQHGLTKTNLLQALSAAIKMYEQMGGKVTAISLVGDLEDKPKTVNLTLEKTNSLIGIELTEKQVEEYLQKLGFELKFAEVDGWKVTVPYWRLDINIEEDLIEEVARIYGYENIPAVEIKGDQPEEIDQSLPNFIYDLKVSLKDTGLTEVQTYSFYSSRSLNALGLNPENAKNAVRVANPISSETEYMRTFIWPNLIEVVDKNIKQGFEDIAIFEIGKVYTPQKEETPKEGYRLSITLMNGSDNPIEELIGIMKQVEDKLGGIVIEKGGLMKELETLFHPTRFATVKAESKGVIGGVAEVHPRFLQKYGITKRVAILEISIDSLL